MNIINAIIVEDMSIAEEHLKKMLHDNCPNVNIIASYPSAKEAIKHLSGLNYDLLFLDIEYNDGYNAFRMLEELDFTETHIIFTTAFEEYRKEAADVDSIKYLLKPIKKDELIRAVDRSMQIIIGKEKLELIEEKYHAVKEGKLIINTNGTSYFLNPSEIVFLEADGAYTHIFYSSEQHGIEKITATHNIGKYGSLLCPQSFIRVHKKYLVNIDFIKSCHRNKLILDVGKENIEVLISKDRRKAIIEAIALKGLDF